MVTLFTLHAPSARDNERIADDFKSRLHDLIDDHEIADLPFDMLIAAAISVLAERARCDAPAYESLIDDLWLTILT